MRGGRDSDDDEDDDDDDTIPELPDEIDTDVGELRGGPFNYGNSKSVMAASSLIPRPNT